MNTLTASPTTARRRIRPGWMAHVWLGQPVGPALSTMDLLGM